MGMRGRGMGGRGGGMGGRGGGMGGRGGGMGGGPRQADGREGLGPRAQQRIRDAQGARQAGRHDEAASAFAELAATARERGMERVAAQLSVQEARCHAARRDGAAASQAADRALADARGIRGPKQGLSGRFAELIAELRAGGQAAAADAIAARATSVLGEAPRASAPGPAGSSRPALPSHCPSCGGPISSAEVDWNDDDSADCDYCGVTLTG